MFRNFKVFVIFFIFSAIFITGCNLSPVEIKQVHYFDVKNINKNKILLEITATVKNPNSRVKIKDSEFTLFLKEKEIGKITQLENIILQGKSTEKYTTMVNLEIKNVSGGLLAAYKLLGTSKNDLTINGTAKVRMPLYYKTINIKNYKVF